MILLGIVAVSGVASCDTGSDEADCVEDGICVESCDNDPDCASGSGGSSGGTGGGAQAGAEQTGAGQAGAGASEGEICTPGATQHCFGPGACEGGQRCLLDGSGWGECDCGPGAGGATGGSGGSGDTGGTAGSGGSGDAGGAGGSSDIPPGCGDGSVVAPEECDDGNTTASDGCSRQCTIEDSHGCTPPAANGRLVLPAVYRDFLASHPDFEPGATGIEEATTGLVENTLGDDGRPVLATPEGNIESAETFAQWYSDVADTNSRIDGELVLFDNGEGGYVNRWGADGEQWVWYQDTTWCGAIGSNCSDCDLGGNECHDPCPIPDYDGSCTTTEVTYDGDPFFFPIDGAADAITPDDEESTATIAPAYGANWDAEPGGSNHNFHFTTELRFWFRYQDGQSYSVEIAGDDDVWVFVNGQLAIDLGGIHTPVEGSVTLNGDNAGDYGLSGGTVYEVAIFQAERQTTASTFRLTLTGFGQGPSVCGPLP